MDLIVIKKNKKLNITKVIPYEYLVKKIEKPSLSPVVVGAGPAGLFSAYELISNNKKFTTMSKLMTFNELRNLKDSLPDGSMHRIADELGVSVETVRNFFGGQNFQLGQSVGIHLEPGPDGGLVRIDDTTVLDKALAILEEVKAAEAPAAEEEAAAE